MRTWHNVYRDALFSHPLPNEGGSHGSAMSAEACVLSVSFLRVEERWNGHTLRPCVGMQLGASHIWINQLLHRTDNFHSFYWTLKRRQ